MSKPKILIADIETSPNVGYFWRPGNKISVSHGNIVEERKVICVSYKYLDENKVTSLKWDKNKDDKKLVGKFSEVLSKADVVVFHNGDAFDIKWIKGRVLFHGLPPLTNVVSIDTLKLSRQNFNLNSHALDYLSKYLGSEGKMTTSFKLWKDIMAGDRKSLAYMVKYCEKDVIELERVFKEILPYCDRLPVNLAILKGGTRDDCPSCGGRSYRYGTKVTRVGKYQKFQCQSCGHVWADSRLLKEKK
jgi:DNA polymerase elongation subunit (family B)